MTIREAKKYAVIKLRNALVASAALDAEVLLSEVLKISRVNVIARDEQTILPAARAKYKKYLTRRARREPVAYIIGRKEFFGLSFSVNRHTLIPRPETELVVEETLAECAKTGATGVYDIGTGSGAIAVALAKNLPQAVKIYATDISRNALKTAATNARKNGVKNRISFSHGDLSLKNLKRLKNRNAVIAANLPYLPAKVWEKCAPEVKKYEPKNALVSDANGLAHYRRLLEILKTNNFHGTLVCEIDPSQKKSFPRRARKYFTDAETKIKNDLAGLARVAITAV
jgi:release factor glutamine methyltransferase